MSETNPAAQPPTSEQISLAWDIHKDADGLLHDRLNAFLVVQALMFGAYFVATDLSEAQNILYQVIIFIAGAGVSIGYWRLSQRMIHGILHLKTHYLVEHMPVYQGYYRAWDKAGDKAREKAGKKQHKDLTYPLHQWTPWAFFVLWIALIGIAASKFISVLTTT